MFPIDLARGRTPAPESSTARRPRVLHLLPRRDALVRRRGAGHAEPDPHVDGVCRRAGGRRRGRDGRRRRHRRGVCAVRQGRPAGLHLQLLPPRGDDHHGARPLPPGQGENRILHFAYDGGGKGKGRHGDAERSTAGTRARPAVATVPRTSRTTRRSMSARTLVASGTLEGPFRFTRHEVEKVELRWRRAVMNRREFVKLAGSGVSAGALAEAVVSAQAERTPAQARPAGAKAAPAAKMKLGTQQGEAEDDPARAARRSGSTTSAAACRPRRWTTAWTVDGLSKRARPRRGARHLARHGASADELQRKSRSARCRRSTSAGPDRDREIDDICQMIRNCARAGITQVKYNFTLIGIPRTRHRAGTRPTPLQRVRLCQARSRIRR